MTAPPTNTERSDFLVALRNGLILGAVILAVVLPYKYFNGHFDRAAPVNRALGGVVQSMPRAPAVAAVPQVPHVPRMADFGTEVASVDARHVANWAFYTGDNQRRAVVVVDKKAAHVYVFNPEGGLVASTPALMGSAIGDHTVPGIGDKPIAEVLPEERTTPAGRFVAEPGFNANHEDIVWVDYNAAVSMHRVRPTVKSERRLERLASTSIEDNRISFGCINLPVAFYEGVLSPTVKSKGAIVYVLPETKTPQEVFASFDVPAKVELASR